MDQLVNIVCIACLLGPACVGIFHGVVIGVLTVCMGVGLVDGPKGGRLSGKEL